MKIKISNAGTPLHTASATLLGHNLELCADVVPGLLSDRLNNPKFLGPAHPQTNIANGWQPVGNNFQGVRYELAFSMSMSGNESQLVHNYSGRSGCGILQTGRCIRKGEKLEVELWARAQAHPAKIKVGLMPLYARKPQYSSAEIQVDATYWKRYTAVLKSPADDNEAVFFCHVLENGMVWFDQIHLRPKNEPLLKKDLFKAIKTLGIPVLRFPGGCITTNYHWKHGTGPTELRPAMPDPIFKWETLYDFGTDEYLELCTEFGIMPQIIVNIGSGTPREAGEWAQYVAEWYKKRKIKPPLAYWQMGNEHYGSWELGNMTGEMYAAALTEFVPKVKAAYPNSRIVALGVETGGGTMAGESHPWRKPVLEKAAHLFDCLATQNYAAPWDNNAIKRHYAVLQGAENNLKAVQGIIDDCKKMKLQKTAAITEWNLWFQASHYDGKGFLETYDVEHGLFTAAMLHGFVRLAPGLELANFYNLVNPMGVFISRGPEVVETTLADVFRLYRPAFPGKIVPLNVHAPKLANGIPAVDAVSLTNREGTWHFITNQSPAQSAEIELTGTGKITTATMLCGDTLEGNFKTATLKPSNNKLRLPPLAIARLQSKGNK